MRITKHTVVSGQMTGIGYCALSLLRAFARVGKKIEWVSVAADPFTTSSPKTK
jgi:hypothetical protein